MFVLFCLIRKELKDKIENHLYFCSKYGIVENCKKCKFISLVGFYKHLQGLIIYVKHIDNTLGVKYLNEFNSLPWDKFIIELATIRDVSVD